MLYETVDWKGAMKIEDLTQEQVDQFRACSTYEELMKLADDVGLELDESQTAALRLSFEDPDAFAARVREAAAEDEKEAMSEDELKAVAGGVKGDAEYNRAYWAAIVPLCSSARVRGEFAGYAKKYGLVD